MQRDRRSVEPGSRGGLLVRTAVAAALLALPLAGCGGSRSGIDGDTVTLLNVSYDPTREFFTEYNAAFAEHYRQQTGLTVRVDQSHGGAGKQARSVLDGLPADVVTLALAYDIDVLANRGQLLPADWQSRLEQRSCPYRSTIVFLVRDGNPKNIRDWDDLVRDDVAVITPNPKTSGGARYNYLAAWGYSLNRSLGDLSQLSTAAAADVAEAQAEAERFVGEIFKRVPVLDAGARGATNTFIQRGLGDVLLTWENEAHLAMSDGGGGKVQLVVPSLSILAEPPVTVVDRYAQRHGTTEVATAYLQYLYSPVGQQLAAKHHYRPALPELVDAELLAPFADLRLFTVDDVFGSWAKAQADHFDDGGVFDQLYRPGR